MKKPTVFIVKEQMTRNAIGSTPIDYGPAMEYGDIEFITEFDLPSYGCRSSVFRNWAEDVAKFVDKYDPATDFIVVTGQPSAIFAVGYVLGTVKKEPRFLIWKREENKYRPMNFEWAFHTSN